MKPCLIIVALLWIPLSQASIFSMDANQYGMGGVGLVSASPKNGYIYNPALNAAYQEDNDTSFFYLSAGFQLIDTTNTRKNIRRFSEKYDTSVANNSKNNIDSTIDALNLIDRQQPSIALLGSTGITFNHKALSLSLFYQVKGFGFIYNDIVQSDLKFLEDTGNLFEYLETETNPALIGQAIIDYQSKYGVKPQNFDTFHFKSNFTLSSVQIDEYGINFGSSLDDNDSRWLVGITIKKQEVHTYSLVNSINSEFKFDDIDSVRDIRQFYDGANVDIGARYELMEDQIYVAGTINNLFPHKYALPVTVSNHQSKYTINPVLSIGIAYLSNIINAEINAEVNPAKHFEEFKGYEVNPKSDDTQIINFGVEATLLYWLKLRMGYFYDINQVIKQRMTLGLGLSPFDLLHFDVGISYEDLTNFTTAASFGVSF